MFIKKLLPLFVLLISFTGARSQTSDLSDIREKFSYETVQIEEFIERFNFDNNTKLLKYLHTNYPNMNINRRNFMITLFDGHIFKKEDDLVKDFINEVCDSVHPVYLDFYDKNWYAEVTCRFDYDKRVDNGKLTLMSQTEADSSSKWVITGVSSELLTIPEGNNDQNILSPVSHGTGFIALYDAFKNGRNVMNYLPDNYEFDQLSFLAGLIYTNQITIQEVSSTRYHFLQIPGWVIVVDYINRKDLNSGWLITDIKRIGDEAKKEYKKSNLHISSCRNVSHSIK